MHNLYLKKTTKMGAILVRDLSIFIIKVVLKNFEKSIIELNWEILQIHRATLLWSNGHLIKKC